MTKTIQGLENYSYNEIIDIINDFIMNRIWNSGHSSDDIKLTDIRLHGSRLRGQARDDSDLDAVVEYDGDIRDDDFFSILNDEDPLYIDDVRVDINPIKEDLDLYMKRSHDYDRMKLKERHASLESRVAYLESLLDNTFNTVYKIYDKYSDYDYADMDVSNYRIKSIKEFNTLKGGVCWDFVIPIANDLDVKEVPYTCYFTGLHKNGNMIASHTYIVTDTSPRYWIECSWMRNKGVHEVSSFKDVENALKSSYNADEVFTVSYVPRKTQGMNPEQFFNYLEDTGIEC